MTVADCIAEIRKATEAISKLSLAASVEMPLDEKTAKDISNMLCEYRDMLNRMKIQED